MLKFRPRFDRRQRGFTLAEILVTTAIFAIIMIAALTVYDQSNRIFKTSTESADMQQSTRIGFDKLVSDVRMAGFDYSRGGVPQQAWQAPQPDEQIEYAGPTALAFRANFNYNTGSATGNGIEPSYTPYNVNGDSIFPYVTTSNDEIVAYVLRSANAAANTNSISFWLDDYQPRAAFPPTINPAPAGSSPSHPERDIVINNIDTTNANPPYTLYRMTITDVHNGALGTPVAENIRSLNFQYYTDAAGATLLANNDGTAITTGRNGDGSTFAAANTGAIGGAGQYDPSNIGATANFIDRTQRSLIQAIRVSLVGMNSSPDLQGYINPTETISSIRNYREYGLSSLVVPRNLGKTGFPEPVYNAPGPPTITSICVGYCGAPVITWTPPASGGPVVYYQITWATNTLGPFGNPTTVNNPTATSYTVVDDGASDVSQARYYQIQAFNDNGPGAVSQPFPATAQSSTTPMAATNVTATGGPNAITLTWTVPTNNTAAQSSLSCNGTGNNNGSLIPPGGQEQLRFRVYRGENPNFDPTSSSPAVDKGVKLLAFSTLSGPNAAYLTPGSTATFVDAPGTSPYPPAPCKTYYYRVQVASRCALNANWNVSPNTSISDFAPALNSNAVSASSTSAVTPTAPTLSLDFTRTSCAGGTCQITLNWTKVASDTSGQQTAVDTYRITRSNRVVQAMGAFVPDPTFGTGGQLLVDCSIGTCSMNTYTQQTGLNVYTDTAPQTQGGNTLQYQYTVAALGCQNAVSSPNPAPNDPYSVESNAVQYPGCNFNPAITAPGSIGGSGTQLSPYVMPEVGASSINVVPATGTNVTSVQFVTTPMPAGAPIGPDSTTIAAPGSPAGTYVLPWVDQTEGQTYAVTITITDNTGCQEQYVEYVEQESVAPCAFNNVATAPPVNLTTASNTTTDTESFTVTNTGTDPIVLALNTMVVTWALPVGDVTHTDMKLRDVVINGTTFNSSPLPASLASPGPTVTQFQMPSGVANVAAGASFTVTFHFTYAKNDDLHTPPLAADPLQKICIEYTHASELGITKFCNLLGQSVTTNNPNACD